MHNTQRIVLIALSGLAIGSGVVAARFSMGSIPAEIMAILRILLAIPAFVVVLVVTRGSLPHRASIWLALALGGLTNVGIPTITLTLALKTLSSGVLTVITSAMPLGAALVAHFWLANEKLTPRRVAGLGLALCGTLLLILTGTNGLVGVAPSPEGYAWAFGGVASGAFSAVYTRRHLQSIEIWPSATIQMLAALAVALPLAALAQGFDPARVSPGAWMAAVYSGLVGSFTAFWLYLTIIKRFGATAGTLSGYVVPVVATALGALLLAENVTPSFIGGAALILMGVFLAGS